jgi:hypothetical protein
MLFRMGRFGKEENSGRFPQGGRAQNSIGMCRRQEAR